MSISQSEQQQINEARKGNQAAFEQLFAKYQPSLKSYFYRLTTVMEDVEDLTQETFLKAFHNIDTFQGRSSFKTWLFRIGTNTARNHHRAQKRWPVNAKDLSKALVMSSADLQAEVFHKYASAPETVFELREHIDYCFTCIMKTLPLEQQLALMLAEFYAFKGREIAEILDVTLAAAKHLLHNARSTMRTVFEGRCALINKEGVCHQCSELSGVLNPKADAQQAIAQNELTQAAQSPQKNDLLEIRLELIRTIDPLEAKGTDFHNQLVQTIHTALQQESKP